jgi:hypothetical protein
MGISAQTAVQDTPSKLSSHHLPTGPMFDLKLQLSQELTPILLKHLLGKMRVACGMSKILVCRIIQTMEARIRIHYHNNIGKAKISSSLHIPVMTLQIARPIINITHVASIEIQAGVDRKMVLWVSPEQDKF